MYRCEECVRRNCCTQDRNAPCIGYRRDNSLYWRRRRTEFNGLTVRGNGNITKTK